MSYFFDPNPWRRRRVPVPRPVHIPVRRTDDPAPAPDEPEQTPPAAGQDVSASAPSPAAPDRVDSWQERYLRLQADLENTKKRLEKRYVAETEKARRDFLRDMLPLADNLHAAIAYASQDSAGADNDLRQGVEVTLRAFLDTLKRHGVVPIEAQGQPFDPTLHEAIGQVTDTDFESGQVVQVVQTGYTDGDALLRPARVLIAA